MRGYPTDLNPAGAAQAGVGSERAPTGRDGPAETGDEDTRTGRKSRKRNADLAQKALSPHMIISRLRARCGPDPAGDRGSGRNGRRAVESGVVRTGKEGHGG
ncbi:hypothetical protein Aca07nite_11280 [Actinoplanes capillaceus]|uniref:Uncharacterized protein n=1 Tax=Actinoplanes campanulatus TaxID=113559 RepID=A0ABQ3WCF7_9ACTN|nr:hypothetical protein Aca07nite_11280 [Actinoplanes capillaceus]